MMLFFGGLVVFVVDINGIELKFEASGVVFSPFGVDRGTRALLSIALLSPGDKLLDLGCGYGAVGIYAAKIIGEQNVVMSDVDEVCIELSKKNAKLNDVGGVSVILSDGFDDIPDNDFSLILSNPPYHSDFSVPKRFIEKGFNRLVVGGKMYMVTKRKDWYFNKLTAIFGGVKVHKVDEYYVFCSEKRSMQYAKTKNR
jgi:16S rRNA (guanine1207-N2)-methyltransferase